MYRLVVASDSGESFERRLVEDRLTIGRSSDAGLTLEDRFLSREHLVFFRDGDDLVIEDLGSRNGTTVNDVRIQGPTRLRAEDRIGLGRYTLTVKLTAATGPDTQRASAEALEGSILIPAARLLGQGFLPKEPVPTPGGAADELGRYLERLRLLDEVHRSLARSISLDQLLDVILDRVFDHLGPEEGVVVLKKDDGRYEIVARRRVPELSGETFYSETLIREVAEKRQGALVLDAQTDQRFAEAASVLGSGVRSIVAAPLAVDDESLGLIAMSSRLSERHFDERDLELLGSLASVAALRIHNVGLAVQAAERRRLEAEVALARTIQEELLPADLPEVPGYEVMGINRPSRGVSGDLYQVIETESPGSFYSLLYDVSGKGLAASLLTATIDALAAAPIANNLPVARLFTLVNARLEQRTSADRFATAFAARMSTATGVIEYASAGHNPALLIRSSGPAERLTRTGLPLGVMTDGRYEGRELELAGGDLLVVYTDGITEAADREGEEYGLERLEQVCVRNRGLPIERIAAAIEQDVARFAAGVPFEDDRTLLLLRRSAPTADSTHGKISETDRLGGVQEASVATLRNEFPRSLSALGGLLDFLGSALEEYAVDQASTFWTQLAAEEIFTNMVRHNRSTGDRITLQLEVSDDAVTTRMTDYGAEPFDPGSVPAVDPSLPARERTPGGLGVFIVRSKMDRVDYRHDNGNMTVTLTKHRQPSS